MLTHDESQHTFVSWMPITPTAQSWPGDHGGGKGGEGGGGEGGGEGGRKGGGEGGGEGGGFGGGFGGNEGGGGEGGGGEGGGGSGALSCVSHSEPSGFISRSLFMHGEGEFAHASPCTHR